MSFADLTVNLFLGAHNPAPARVLTLAEALDLIRRGTYKQEVLKLRQILTTVDGEKAYRRRKNDLNAFTFCGTFSPSRAKEHLLQHNGIVHGDLDHLPDLAAAKRALCADPTTAFCFVSPSGTGLKLGVLVEPVTDDTAYKLAWQAVADYHCDTYGLAWDQSAKNISRLCFASWDPELYSNPEAALFPVPLMVIPPPRPPAPPRPADKTRDIPSDRRERYAQQATFTAVKIIDASTPGNRHHARTKAGYLLGGYVAGNVLSKAEARAALEEAVRRNTDDFDRSMRTIDDCLQAGMAKAISLEDLEAARE